jgi:hypothetical protein
MHKLKDLPLHMRTRKWIESEIEYELAIGVHTYHKCECGRKMARSTMLERCVEGINSKGAEDMKPTEPVNVLKPQYKNKTFKNKELFEIWLKKTATQKIVFEDDGQDFLEWYIDKNGEVLHCTPFQCSIWNGKMVDTFNMRKGVYLPLQNGISIQHRVKKILDLK